MTIAAPKPAKATTASAGPDRAGGVGRRGGGAGERHERGRVDQPEHEEGEAHGPDAGATVGRPADDGHADDVVEAPRQRGAGDAGSAARSTESQRLRALVRGEEPVPAVGLERVGEQEEDAGGDHDRRWRPRTASRCRRSDAPRAPRP